jgi:DNA adenine methylase
MRRRGPTARPVLKWAGGKTQLLPEILRRAPGRIRTYFEPFVGGGAVFFALAAEGRFERAVLADSNPELVNVYQAIKADVNAVIRALLRFGHSEEEYYAIRDSKPRTPAGRAARTIYLNKTGYNGLYRVNRSGEFNVPFGRYKNPNYCDRENLEAVARVLADVEIEVADFEQTCARAERGDFVYLDPPYVPLSKTSNFTAYDRHPFGLPEQQRLAALFGELHARGVRALLSNSFTPETEALYAAWQCEKVSVARMINSRSSGRGPVPELLVTNVKRKRAASPAGPDASRPSATARTRARSSRCVPKTRPAMVACTRP